MVIDETLAENPELVRAAASATLLAVENGASRASCAPRASGSSRPATPSGGASSATCTTAPSSASSRCGSTSRSRPSSSIRRRAPGDARAPRHRGRRGASTSCARSRTASIRQLLSARRRRRRRSRSSRAQSRDARHASSDAWRGRHSEAIETTVYFCCLECLQNAAKHAGPAPSATISLGEADGSVGFSVEDDGAGFDPAPSSTAPASPTSPTGSRPSAAPSGSTRALAAERASSARYPLGA